MFRSHRGVWAIVACAALAVVLAATWWGSNPAPPDRTGAASEPLVQHPGPQLAHQPDDLVGFTESFVDIGQVPWGTEVPVSLPFVNRSDEPVTIEGVEASCGCTLVLDADAYRARVVGPGEEIDVQMMLDTGPRPGERWSQVKVAARGPREFTAILKATVVGTWDLSADCVHFGTVLLDSPDEAVTTVWFTSDVDRLAGVPEPSVPWLACSVGTDESAQTAGTSIRLRVLKDKLSPGTNSGFVTVTTTCPSMPARRVYVTARGISGLLPYPPHLVLLSGQVGKVQFVDAAGAPAQVASVDVGDAPVEGRPLANGYVEFEAPRKASGTRAARVYAYDAHGRRGVVLVSVVADSLVDE